MTRAGIIPNPWRLAAIAAALALTTTYAAANGIPGVTMTDSQNLTDWSGLYVGGKLGGAWGNVDWSQDVNVFTAGGAVAPNSPVNFSPSGIAGGVIAGANLQLGQWIFGAELSFSGTDLSQTVTSPFFPATDTFSTELNWLGTVEGRIGYSWDRVMVFGKGGWAGSNAKLSVVRSTGGRASTAEFVDGWTIGGGIDYAAWNSVIIGLEYDYVSLSLTGAGSCPLCSAGVVIGSTPASVAGDATFSSVMVRASYLFTPED